MSGAVCPECKAHDEVVVYELDGRDTMECLACGFKQQRPSIDEMETPKLEDAELSANGVQRITLITK